MRLLRDDDDLNRFCARSGCSGNREKKFPPEFTLHTTSNYQGLVSWLRDATIIPEMFEKLWTMSATYCGSGSNFTPKSLWKKIGNKDECDVLGANHSNDDATDRVPNSQHGSENIFFFPTFDVAAMTKRMSLSKKWNPSIPRLPATI